MKAAPPHKLEPMNIDGREFDFDPPVILEAGSGAEVDIRMPDGRACIIVRCVVTHALIEARRDCQVIDIGERSIIVAAPSSIERPKLSWKIRMLRWLAKG
jgi:hypothetical protein